MAIWLRFPNVFIMPNLKCILFNRLLQLNLLLSTAKGTLHYFSFFVVLINFSPFSHQLVSFSH